MAQLFQASVYEINGNPGSVPVGPKYMLFAPGEILRVTQYTGTQIYRCYAYIYTGDGNQYGVSESVAAIKTAANA